MAKTPIPDVPPEAAGPGGLLSENIMHFGRVLRRAGLPIGPGQVLAALNAVEAVGLGSRVDFYWTLYSVFVNRRDQRDLFDQAFHIFWRNPDILERMMQIMLPDAGGAQTRCRRQADQSVQLPGAPVRALAVCLSARASIASGCRRRSG